MSEERRFKGANNIFLGIVKGPMAIETVFGEDRGQLCFLTFVVRKEPAVI